MIAARLAGEGVEAFRDARVMVLGASGFIGRWVARAMAAAGADLVMPVRDVGRAQEMLRALDVQGTIVPCDVVEPGALAALIRATQPALVFNLAGYGVDRTERDDVRMTAVNGDLPAALCDALTATPAGHWRHQRLVHVGSALEYGHSQLRLDEDVSPQPTTAYGRSKLAGTRSVQRHGQATGLRCLTARLFTVFGAGEHAGRLLPTLLDAARRRIPAVLSAGLQCRDFTYVEDVAEGLWRLALSDAPPGAIVNVATGVMTSVRDFALTAARALDIPTGRLQFGGAALRDDEMVHHAVSVDRLRTLTQFAPATTIRDGVLKTREFEHAARSCCA